MKKEEIKTKDNIEKLEKVIEEKKKIPQKVKEKINSKTFENIIFAVVIFVYLGALNLGMKNIPTENYLLDLKVFGMMLLAVTIVLFEVAYKKEKGSLWIHGAETMCLAVFTMYLVYFYSMYYSTFGNIIFSFAGTALVYYIIKIFIERRKVVKDYNKELIDIGEIVKKVN